MLRIERGGGGGFLNPPTHPEHDWHVGDQDNHLSLSYAVTCDWVDPEIRKYAKRVLKEWQDNKPALNSPEIQEWVLQVLGYFHDCYLPESGSRNVKNILIRKDLNPMDYIDEHRGVDYVRKWYPSFMPTEEHFKNAYWGTKPVAVKA